MRLANQGGADYFRLVLCEFMKGSSRSQDLEKDSVNEIVRAIPSSYS